MKKKEIFGIVFVIIIIFIFFISVRFATTGGKLDSIWSRLSDIFFFNRHITYGAVGNSVNYGVGEITQSSGKNTENYLSSFSNKIFASITSPPQCSDGLDNDLDGYVDYPQDPGCSSSTDQEEFNSPPPPSPVNGLVAGGLVWFPQTALGPNILQNNSFESLDANGKLQFWSGSAAFSIDNTVAKSGQNSYRMKDAPNYPYRVCFSGSFFKKRNL